MGRALLVTYSEIKFDVSFYSRVSVFLNYCLYESRVTL